MSGLVKRSVTLAGHRTSVALEPLFWDVLTRLSAQRGEPLAKLIATVDAERSPDQPLASALRIFALSSQH